jgi:hypothetical protein
MLGDLLGKAAMGLEKRIIVEMPPRHGKSELATVHFPVWYLGKFPRGSIVVTSANEDLASEFSVRSRDIFAEWPLGHSCEEPMGDDCRRNAPSDRGRLRALRPRC